MPDRYERPLQDRDPVTGRLQEPTRLDIDRFDTLSLRRYLVPVSLIGCGLGWLAWELTRRSRGQIHLREPERSTPSRLPVPNRESVVAVVTADDAVSSIEAPSVDLPDLSQAPSIVQGAVRDHPIASGLAIVAAGALASYLLPSSQTEDELLGEARERLVERAKAERSRLGHHGKKVAHAAFLAAKDEIRRDIPRVDGLSARLRDIARRPEEVAYAEAEKRQVTPADLAEVGDEMANEITEFGIAN